jgi:serine protease AprX
MDDVLYLEPVQTDNPPPQDEVDDGRALMNSDPYFGQATGTIGLLDTGVRWQHVQFQSPSHLGVRRDCVNGGTFCLNGTNPNDDCWNHGTASAGILTANACQGDAFRGVTAFTVDSFKIYPSTFAGGVICGGSLDTGAALRGFQGALVQGDRVIVASIQGFGGHSSSISLAADAAFDAGAVVVAANGNYGPLSYTVSSPANAHRALGVGSFNVRTLAQQTSQSRGPTSDGHTKPDFQTPTSAETASTGCPFGIRCDQTHTERQNFGGTSGAVPFAGGAAAVVRSFLRELTGVIEPGFTYAYLIDSGQQPFFNDSTGVGQLRLPSNGEMYIAKVGVNDRQTLDFPIQVRGTPTWLDAAIWWPEYAALPHNDIDLELINPNGAVVVTSMTTKSVFERVRATMPMEGRWTVRVRGYNVLLPQAVYIAFAIQ